MKIGDTVILSGSHAKVVGMIVSKWKIDDWWEVMTAGGYIIHWPGSQMRVVEA